MKKITKILMLGLFAFNLSSCIVINVDSKYTYDDSDEYEIGNATIEKEVEKIELDWIKGDVQIIATSNSYISFEEKCEEELLKRQKVHYYFDSADDTLHIKYCGSTKHLETDIPVKDLTIYVPSTYSKLFMEINVVSADISSTSSSIINYNFNSVSGKLNVSATNEINEITSNTYSGQINIKAPYVKLLTNNTTSGKANIQIQDGDSMDLNSVSADINISIPTTLGFTVNYDALKDRFSSNVPIIKKENECTYGDGKLSITCNSISGKLTVNVE